MLQVSYLRQHTQLAKELLAIKHFSNLGLVDQVIEVDDQRKRVQASFDDLQSKVNAASKEIGNHMAKGEKEQAETLKQNGGWTDKFIIPPYDFKIANTLITNFHLPESTLLMTASAFGGYPLIMKAYKEAIKEKYRFFSYGDSMLIL